MAAVVNVIKEKSPATPIYVGGAPLSQEFSDKIGATGFFHDPHGLIKNLSK